MFDWLLRTKARRACASDGDAPHRMNDVAQQVCAESTFETLFATERCIVPSKKLSNHFSFLNFIVFERYSKDDIITRRTIEWFLQPILYF